MTDERKTSGRNFEPMNTEGRISQLEQGARNTEKSIEDIKGSVDDIYTIVRKMSSEVAGAGKISIQMLIAFGSFVVTMAALVAGLNGAFMLLTTGPIADRAALEVWYVRDSVQRELTHIENDFSAMEIWINQHEARVQEIDGRQWEVINYLKEEHKEHTTDTDKIADKLDRIEEAIYRHQGFKGHGTGLNGIQ